MSHGAHNRTRGATLIELLMAMVIMAVLTAVVAPQLKIPEIQAKAGRLHTNLKMLRDAIGAFLADTGAFPASLEDLTATSIPPHGLDTDGESAPLDSTWHGPYLAGPVPRDPFTGRHFLYNTTTPGQIGHVSSPAQWPYCSW